MPFSVRKGKRNWGRGGFFCEELRILGQRLTMLFSPISRQPFRLPPLHFCSSARCMLGPTTFNIPGLHLLDPLLQGISYKVKAKQQRYERYVGGDLCLPATNCAELKEGFATGVKDRQST